MLVMKKIEIQVFQKKDWPAVQAIYAEGVATGNATFETRIPDWEKWDAGHIDACRFVARVDEELAGWAALSRVSSRAVYGGVAEVSVYVGSRMQGEGVGRRLLTELVVASERAGFWTLQASIFPENVASLRLHESCGFRVVGQREKIAQLRGVWRDTVLMERRSTVAT
jgi:L-amino acid N-acyltransferase YncA